jgi:hypothetical protein
LWLILRYFLWHILRCFLLTLWHILRCLSVHLVASCAPLASHCVSYISSIKQQGTWLQRDLSGLCRGAHMSRSLQAELNRTVLEEPCRRTWGNVIIPVMRFFRDWKVSLLSNSNTEI